MTSSSIPPLGESDPLWLHMHRAALMDPGYPQANQCTASEILAVRDFLYRKLRNNKKTEIRKVWLLLSEQADIARRHEHAKPMA